MRCIIQRVLGAEVFVNNQSVGAIKKGFVVYLGFTGSDTEQEADYIIDRISKIRIFEDNNGKLNLALNEIGAEVLLIPNFTLYADASTGRRPSFVNAMRYDEASALFDYSAARYDSISGNKSQRGVFGADMKINSVADGPLNIIIEYNHSEQGGYGSN